MREDSSSSSWIGNPHISWYSIATVPSGNHIIISGTYKTRYMWLVYSCSHVLHQTYHSYYSRFSLLIGLQLLKPRRLDAVVFWSENTHGLASITSGSRQTFAVELWQVFVSKFYYC